MFEFLFKYSPAVYENGEWTFRYLPGFMWLAIGVVVGFAVIAFIYSRTIAPTTRLFRFSLAAIKALAITLVLLAIAEPFISVTSIVPKKGSVVVLLDNSSSMSLEDNSGEPSRIQQINNWYNGEGADGVFDALQENFNVLSYTFNDETRPLQQGDSMLAEGAYSEIVKALQFAERQAQTYPVSAVILASDGAQVSKQTTEDSESRRDGDPLEAAALFKNLGIPIYTVGVGAQVANDVQLTSVSSSRSVLENDIVDMAALIHAKGMEGKSVDVELLEEGRVVQKKQVQLEKKYTRVELGHKPTRKGNLLYTARVKSDAGEVIEVNNRKNFLVKNEERVGKVFYIETLHPQDFKYIKRAIELDKNLKMSSMVATGTNKWYGQGIDNEGMYPDGFPKTRSELFSYDALIIGSMAADVLTDRQHEWIRDFVSVRGGGLLMIGGPSAFSQGGWQNSPAAEALPVYLLGAEEATKAAPPQMRIAPFKLQLTPEGLRSPLLKLANDLKSNRQNWLDIADLKGYNPVGAAKPGATVLGIHPLSQPNREKIIIAEQRYGRGRSMVIATSSTWAWQMRMHSEDMSHERFWRQVGRWLAMSAPEPVEATIPKDNYGLAESVSIQISVLDSTYEAVRDANISVQVRTPFSFAAKSADAPGQGDPPVGGVVPANAVPDLENSGHYKASFVPDREGLYEIEVFANDAKGRFLGASTAAFYVGDEQREFARPDLRENLLQRIAEISSGKYQHITDAEDIADELVVAESSYSKTVERDLWDSPAVFIAVILLLGIEWFVRRAKGLS